MQWFSRFSLRGVTRNYRTFIDRNYNSNANKNNTTTNSEPAVLKFHRSCEKYEYQNFPDDATLISHFDIRYLLRLEK